MSHTLPLRICKAAGGQSLDSSEAFARKTSRPGARNDLVLLQVRDMREGEETWILKPSLTNQALAVTVFDRVPDLYAALEAAPKLHEWVLQRCVAGRQACMHAQLLEPFRLYHHMRSYLA